MNFFDTIVHDKRIPKGNNHNEDNEIVKTDLGNAYGVLGTLKLNLIQVEQKIHDQKCGYCPLAQEVKDVVKAVIVRSENAESKRYDGLSSNKYTCRYKSLGSENGNRNSLNNPQQNVQHDRIFKIGPSEVESLIKIEVG